MPSTPSDRLRVELQALGENLSTWGDTRLNEALKRLEEGQAKVLTKAVSGNVTLVSQNYVEDEARSFVLVLTGTPTGTFKVTIPGVQKPYVIANRTGFDQTVGASSGLTATIRAGRTVLAYCDGTDTFAIDPSLDQIRPPAANLTVAGNKVTDLQQGTQPNDAVNYQQWLNLRAYAQGIANSGILAPGATVNYFLKWNGTGWVEAPIPPLVAGNNTTVSGSFAAGTQAVNVDLDTPTDFLFALSIARP